MILNLTQHPATAEQVSAGVTDLPATERAELGKLLTFEELPDAGELTARAEAVREVAYRAWLRDPTINAVMIGGAPFFMSRLEAAFQMKDTREIFSPRVLYAFSRRESVEYVEPTTGAVRKTAVFRHAGFVVSA